MKKVLAFVVAAIAMFFVASPAHADYVSFSSGASTATPPYTGDPVYTAPVAVYNANPKTSTIEVEIAGKTCSLTSSAAAFAPQGCNYDIQVTPSGNIEFPRATCDVLGCK